MATIGDLIKGLRLGRRAVQPKRDTFVNPMWQLGRGQRNDTRTVLKPTPRNLRYFSRTPYARRAINAIKNPISMLDWEVVPVRGVDMNSALEQQIEVTTACLERPNTDDSWRSMTEQVIEDICLGAGALEVQLGAPERPLWLFPVDGLSIQLNPAWDGQPNTTRYAQALGQSTASAIQLRNDELIYLRPNPSTATPFGLGPLEVAFLSVSRLLGVGEFAGNVATNARPSIMLSLGEVADQGMVAAFREYWTNEVEGQGRVPIVGAKGADALRLYPEGDSALYLKFQDLLKSEIATAFDLSPQNLGVERDVNRNTAEVGESRDMQHAIRPMADLYASHITREAIQGRLGFSQLRLSFPELEAEDEASLAETFTKDYQNNAMTPAEYRHRKGLPPSDSPFADLLKVEADIAVQAARGTAQVLDPDLPKPANPAPPAQKDA